MISARHVLIVLVLLGGVTLAGCSFQSEGTNYPSESEINDTLGEFDTLEATVVTETTVNGSQTTTHTRLARDFDRRLYRSSVVDGPAAGMAVVMNESVMRYYEPSSNTIQWIDRPTQDTTPLNRTAETVSTIYDRLSDGSEANGDGQVGISPAPTVPSTGTGSGQASMMLPVGDNVSVSNAGTDVVDGRDVRVVKLQTTDEKGLLENATYYIDQEWHLPLKTTVSVQVGNRTSVTTVTYTNVTINGEIDPDTFSLDAPSTATVVDGPNGSFEQFDSRSALVEALDHSVPEPSLPAEYEFEVAEVNPVGSGQSVTIVYTGSTDSVSITKQTVEANLTDSGEPVAIDDVTGRRLSIGSNDAIVWTCDGNSYSVVGSADGVAIEPIVSSMGCP